MEKASAARPRPRPERRSTTLARWGYPLLGLGLLALYLSTLAPGVTFTDGPELTTAVVSLGVAHPTGYPIFILVGHAFCKLLALPLLACVKLEVMNAVCGAAAGVLAARTARALALLGDGGEPGAAWSADVGGLCAGAMLGIAPLVWEEVRIPEVYALHLLLVTWAGHAWVRFEVTCHDPRTPAGDAAYVVAAALPMGIGLAHHVTMVYMLPAAFIYLLARRPSFFVAWLAYPPVRLARAFRPELAAGRRFQGWWGLPAACLVGFVPLLSYGFLIWANRHTTGVSWGSVNDWRGLYDHVTGRQYQSFWHNLDREGHLARLAELAPFFDGQFLPEGTVLFFSGLFFAFRRTWRPALFLLAYLLFNVAHGVHYGVGDYRAYLIPGVYACAVFIGVGLSGLLGVARTRQASDRGWMGFAALGVMLAGAALSIVLYAHITKRLPPALAAHPFVLAAPLALLAVVAAGASVRARRRPGWLGPVAAGALPAAIVAALVISLVPVSLARAYEALHAATLGESYGAEVAQHLPPGSVFMTQGDGFLFTMWYENHVLGRATDAVTVDMSNIRTPWFQRYVFARNPLACDPRSPDNVLDPEAYARRCDSYEKRMAIRPSEPWVSFGFAENRRPYTTSAASAPVLRGDDPRCADKKWHDEHVADKCRCWGYGQRKGAVEGTLEESCVASAEEGGVVPRAPEEVFAQRIVEDMLDERPVFERNTLTQWSGAADNPRGWDGPTYQRISATYALVSRGRFNQIVWSADLDRHDACGDTFRPIPMRPFLRPRALPTGQERRRPYVPNPRPTLLQASYLVRAADGRDDDAARAFRPGEPVFMAVDWFERFYWDATRPDRRGKPIHHGVRVCVFDPDGRRVASREVVSGAKEAVLLLGESATQKVGTYHVTACTVGEVGEQPLPLGDDRRCAWTVLEYELSVR